MKNFQTMTTSNVDTGTARGRTMRAHLAGAHRLLPSKAHAAPLTSSSGI